MKLPISERLLCCTGFIAPGARVADIGTDHGYLGIYLLQKEIAQTVYACDLRERPLARARENAVRFGVADRMQLLRADGLTALSPNQIDTVVCAGMGGDLIASILEAAPWLQSPAYRLILQPQSAGQHLRRVLSAWGFEILRETLVLEGGFLYTVMEARYGAGAALTPGQEYVSPQLLRDASVHLPQYLDRIALALGETVRGLRSSEKPEVRARLPYYETALREVQEMRRTL